LQEWEEKDDFDSSNKGDFSKPIVIELPKPTPPKGKVENGTSSNSNNNNNYIRSLRRGSVAFFGCEGNNSTNNSLGNCHKRKAAELRPPPSGSSESLEIPESSSNSLRGQSIGPSVLLNNNSNNNNDNNNGNSSNNNNNTPTHAAAVARSVRRKMSVP
jgi:hypothetical protein